MASFLAGRTARWTLGAVALCLVLLVAAWFLLVTPRRDDAAQLREDAVNSDQQASLLQVKLAELKTQAADLPKQKEKLKEIAEELPPDADIPQYVRTLGSISTTAGVAMKNISPGTPVLVTLNSAAAGDPAAAAAAPAAGSGLGSPGDLVSLPMNLEIDGDYYQLSSWLKSLQSEISRSYLISAFTLTANDVDDGAGGLLGASIADGSPASPTPTATGKGLEGVTPTATDPSVVVPTVVPTAVPTVAPTIAPTIAPTGTTGTTGTDGTTTDTEQAAWTLALTGTVFVLLNDDSTLEDIKRDAAAARASMSGTWTEVTPEATDTPSAAPSVAATDPNTNTN